MIRTRGCERGGYDVEDDTIPASDAADNFGRLLMIFQWLYFTGVTAVIVVSVLSASGPTAAYADESLDTRENTDLTLKCRFMEPEYDADNFTFYWTRLIANPAQFENVAIGDVQLNSGYR